MTRYPSVQQVVAYHDQLLRLQGQEPLLVNLERLESAVGRPQSSAFGEEAFPTLSEKAAALLQGITIGHPFLDGNKRAAVGAMLLFLEMNGLAIETDESALHDLTLAVASGRLSDTSTIAGQLERMFDFGR